MGLHVLHACMPPAGPSMAPLLDASIHPFTSHVQYGSLAPMLVYKQLTASDRFQLGGTGGSSPRLSVSGMTSPHGSPTIACAASTRTTGGEGRCTGHGPYHSTRIGTWKRTRPTARCTCSHIYTSVLAQARHAGCHVLGHRLDRAHPPPCTWSAARRAPRRSRAPPQTRPWRWRCAACAASGRGAA